MAAFLVVTACSEPAGWIGDDPHVVEGYWVLAETPCERAPDAECTIAVDAVVDAMEIESTGITAASTADWAAGYRDGHGNTILATTAGLSRASAVILDLADGTRRLVNVYCGGPVTNDAGVMVEPRTCGSDGSLPPQNRIGHEPWLVSAP